MNAQETIESLCLLAEHKRITLERLQALSALRLIVAQRRANSLTGVLDSIDAAQALLTKMGDK